MGCEGEVRGSLTTMSSESVASCRYSHTKWISRSCSGLAEDYTENVMHRRDSEVVTPKVQTVRWGTTEKGRNVVQDFTIPLSHKCTVFDSIGGNIVSGENDISIQIDGITTRSIVQQVRTKTW